MAEALAVERLPGLLVAAGIASFDPDAAREEGLKVSVAEAIAIVRLKGGGTAPGEKGRKHEGPSDEEMRSEILRRLDAMEAHERKGAGDEGRSNAR